MIGTAKRKTKSRTPYAQPADEAEVPSGLIGGGTVQQVAPQADQSYSVPVDYSQSPLDARLAVAPQGTQAASQLDARLPVSNPSAAASGAANGLRVVTDPTTGYKSYIFDPVGKFPGYSFEELGPNEWRQRAASSGAGPGEWGELVESRGNYRIDPEILGLNHWSQAQFDAALSKPMSGPYQSRLFDASDRGVGSEFENSWKAYLANEGPRPTGFMDIKDAELAASEWANNFSGPVADPTEVDHRFDWIFGGNQPVAMGPGIGYLNDPSLPWDSPNNLVMTSLQNPNYRPAEQPDQFDVSAYTDYLVGRPVTIQGPSRPREYAPGLSVADAKAYYRQLNQANDISRGGTWARWNQDTQRFQDWNTGSGEWLPTIAGRPLERAQ